MNERLPPTPGYYYVRFSNLFSEAYWNGFRWFDPGKRYLPDFSQTLFTHWAFEPDGVDLEDISSPLIFLPNLS